MIIWAYTITCVAALIVGLICGTLAFCGSMPRAMGLTSQDPLGRRDKISIYLSSMSAGLPVLAFWLITLGFWSFEAIVMVILAAGLVMIAANVFLPYAWLVAIRPKRTALGITAVIMCVIAIGARVGQFEALYDGVAPCRDLATSAERRACHDAFERDWRLPDTLTTD